MLSLATLDFLVLAVLLLSLALGAWRGLVYELFFLVGWVVAFFVTRLLAPQLLVFVRPYTGGLEPTMVYALVFVAVFIALVFIWGLLASLAKKLVQIAGLRPVDRVLGGCFGVVRALVLLLVLTMVVQAGLWHRQSWWGQSYAGPWLQQTLAYVLPSWPASDWRRFLPELGVASP